MSDATDIQDVKAEEKETWKFFAAHALTGMTTYGPTWHPDVPKDMKLVIEAADILTEAYMKKFNK